MEAITIFPKNEKQKILLKTLLEEMRIPYAEGKEDESVLSKDEFFAKVDKAIQQAAEGKVKKIDKDSQRELLGL